MPMVLPAEADTDQDAHLKQFVAHVFIALQDPAGSRDEQQVPGSAVAESEYPPPWVLLTTMPRAVQAGVSSEALRAPVIPNIRNFGRRLISEPGNGVRSRIESTISKSAVVLRRRPRRQTRRRKS